MTVGQRLITIMKEYLKFALVTVVIFISVGTLSFYILTKLSMVNDLSMLLVGIMMAFLTIFIDRKKLHSRQKIAEQFTFLKR